MVLRAGLGVMKREKKKGCKAKYPKLFLNFNVLYSIYRVVHASVRLKHSLVLTGMFRFKPASQFVEPYHRAVNCALNMEDLISNNFFIQ
jgi:hypothetical protein